MVDVWSTAPPAPFLTIGEHVSVWTLGGDNFRIDSPHRSRVVRGYKLARVVAHETEKKLSPEERWQPTGKTGLN